MLNFTLYASVYRVHFCMRFDRDNVTAPQNRRVVDPERIPPSLQPALQGAYTLIRASTQIWGTINAVK